MLETDANITTPVPMPIRRRPVVSLDRRIIIEATDRCLFEEGYDATTIRRIAARLGCAVGSIYRHFTDKRQLLEAVTQRRLEPVVDLAERGGAIEHTAEVYARAVLADRQAYRLMFWLASLAPEESKEEAGACGVGGRAVPAIVRRLVQAWCKRVPEEKARRAWAALHGALMLNLGEQAAVREVELILNPLRAQPGIHITSSTPPRLQPEPLALQR